MAEGMTANEQHDEALFAARVGACTSTDKAVIEYLTVRLKQEYDRAEAAEAERDEALDYNRACNEMREQHKARAEAAEAERDRLAVCCACVVERANEAAEAELAHEFGMRTAWQYRAKAAEARLVDEQRRYTEACNNYSTLQLRAEAAEARIAAALAYLDNPSGDFRTINGVRRALTGNDHA